MATMSVYGGHVAKWLGSASMTMESRRGHGGEEEDVRSGDLKRQAKGGVVERSYIMFDRAGQVGPPVRGVTLDDVTDAILCANTVQGPFLIADDRGG